MMKFFPVSAQAKKSVTHFVVVLAIYIICGWLLNLVTWIPVVGLLARLVQVYCLAGIIVTLLYYFGFIKS